MRVVGLDLAGSEKRDTGFAAFDGKNLQVRTLHDDRDILRAVGECRPRLVLIDAPLSLPRGRRLGIRENSIIGSRKIHFRACDLELRRRGIPFFPITLGPMRMLTVRGLRLKKVLERRSFPCLEGYPGGAQDLWSLPRNRDMPGLLRGLRRLGLRGLKASHSKDELDAATLALLAWKHLRGMAKLIGDPREGQMLIPETEGEELKIKKANSREDKRRPAN